MIFQPDEIIPVVYNISDPNDSTTYYVQAILRDTKDGTTLATQNLTGSGRRFSGNAFRAPFVNTGNMRIVDITVTVYTDAGYTTKSDMYQEENFTYQVSDRWSISLLGGVGGGGIKRKELVDLFEQEFSKFIKMAEEFLTNRPPNIIDTVSFEQTVSGLGGRFDEQMRNVMAEVKKAMPGTRMAEIKSIIDDAKTQILGSIIPKFEVFRTLEDRVRELADSIENTAKKIKTDNTSNNELMRGKIEDLVSEMRSVADDMRNVEVKVSHDLSVPAYVPRNGVIPTIADLRKAGKL